MICYEKDGAQMIVNENMARVMESCGYKRAVDKTAPSSVDVPKEDPAGTDTGKAEPKPKQYQKSEIMRMSTADLKETAKTIGLEVADESTGKMLKEQIIEKLGL